MKDETKQEIQIFIVLKVGSNKPTKLQMNCYVT